MMHKMLKQGVSAEDVRIYDLYLQRIMKEYDLIWSRFKIYLTFNSGVFIVMGFFIAPYVGSRSFSDIPNVFWGICLALSAIGIVFSVAWYYVNADGRKWELFMNRILGRIEDTMFEEGQAVSLYKAINEDYPPNSRPKRDVVDINLRVAQFFGIIFTALMVLSVVGLAM